MPLPSLVRVAARLPMDGEPHGPLLLLATVAATACATLVFGAISVYAREQCLRKTLRCR